MYIIKFTPGFEEISLNYINVGNNILKLRLLNNFLSKFPHILLLLYDRCLVDKIHPSTLVKATLIHSLNPSNLAIHLVHPHTALLT